MTARPTSVLVVDDEPQMCNGLRRILESEGYVVVSATDGEMALELAADDHPDLVLLDLMMPGIGGREVCRQIREQLPDVRIVYFTARVELVDARYMKEIRREADGIIFKPATTRQILSKVTTVLGTGH
jgi:CheY-like chemotaxis protein